MKERETRILEFFSKGRSEGGPVCPFASKVVQEQKILVCSLPQEETNWPMSVMRVCREYLYEARGMCNGKGEGRACVLCFADDPPDFEQARASVCKVHELICAAFTAISLAVPIEATIPVCKMRADKHQYPMLTLPWVSYAIGMGPQYEDHHPRYAPVTCMVLTWMLDVEQTESRVKADIRREMVRATGVLYDADEPWLEKEPKQGTKKTSVFFSWVLG